MNMEKNTGPAGEGPVNPALRRPFDGHENWFEQVYTHANEDVNKVPWARRSNTPLLLSWLEGQRLRGSRTLVVGCGLGDDAEALAEHGLEVTAFDVSPSAIAWCRQRFHSSTVDYQVADLFQLPAAFERGFDLVFEALTIQSMPPSMHADAMAAIAACVAPGGTLLIICFGRQPDEPTDGPPWPLTREELERFRHLGLQEVRFEEHMEGGARLFLAEYSRAAL
ncbi:class I SAM-dependent methyltransferase [Dictyobacter aurantiacus]|uniref:SAM-dependent methyltransferase n=1 Tax=Dictyobacter aurantiacus TaxID=1936993 RepID=A0A401ZK98_9CHLR|nr:class I SAM-dependent methyltransferase [Dictyobacter aurantiacus]GCE07252.1 hypothetical protein KDAU_45810 [Dictyobacter aurantiacus]